MSEAERFDAFHRDTSRRLARYAYGLAGADAGRAAGAQPLLSWTETRLACPTRTGFQVWAVNK